MNHNPLHYMRLLRLAATGVAAILSGCSAPPAPTAPTPAPPAPPTAPTPPAPSVAAGRAPVVKAPTVPPVSPATNPRAYRRDAATHLYERNSERIFKGQLPPLLYAIGVLQVEVDGLGRVTRTSWMRAPKHAPEVIAEIEKTVRLAAPFPVPARMGKVTYTDTWLWHKSGKFQLDTLTEGQL